MRRTRWCRRLAPYVPSSMRGLVGRWPAARHAAQLLLLLLRLLWVVRLRQGGIAACCSPVQARVGRRWRPWRTTTTASCATRQRCRCCCDRVRRVPPCCRHGVRGHTAALRCRRGTRRGIGRRLMFFPPLLRCRRCCRCCQGCGRTGAIHPTAAAPTVAAWGVHSGVALLWVVLVEIGRRQQRDCTTVVTAAAQGGQRCVCYCNLKVSLRNTCTHH